MDELLRNLVRALQSLSVSHVTLDLNPETVRSARQRGESVVFGDCTRTEVLRRVHLEAARVYVVAISDPRSTRQTVQVARHLNPALHVIVRTRYLSEIELLHRLGANQVIAEEFETSLEILTRALHCYNFPRHRIEEVTQHFRGDAYQALRQPEPPGNEKG